MSIWRPLRAHRRACGLWSSRSRKNLVSPSGTRRPLNVRGLSLECLETGPQTTSLESRCVALDQQLLTHLAIC